MHRWGRQTTAKALDELIDARWLAKRRYENAEGHRIFDEYHVHVARRFHEEESAELNRPFVLNPFHVSAQAITLAPSTSTWCLEREHPPGSSGHTKEEQSEDNSEEQQENQIPGGWICDGSWMPRRHYLRLRSERSAP
jgi:hypothetical protein